MSPRFEPAAGVPRVALSFELLTVNEPSRALYNECSDIRIDFESLIGASATLLSNDRRQTRRSAYRSLSSSIPHHHEPLGRIP